MKTITIILILLTLGFLAQGAVVSITFDDEFVTQYTIAAPIMKEFGYRATLYIETNNIGKPGYMTMDQINRLGWEVGAHTVTHSPLPLLRLIPGSITRELSEPQEMLDADHFASPCGFYDGWSLGHIKKYYKSHRTSIAGLNSIEDPDVYELKCLLFGPWAKLSNLRRWVDRAVDENKWLILGFHGFDLQWSINSYSSKKFEELLQYIYDLGIPVKTIGEMLGDRTSKEKNES